MNVWTPELHKRFFELLSDFLSDDEAHVGILTSSGDRAFSAGDDLKTPRPAWSEGELAERYLNGCVKGRDRVPGLGSRGCQTPRTKPIVVASMACALGRVSSTSTGLRTFVSLQKTRSLAWLKLRTAWAVLRGGMQLGHSIAHVDAMYLALTGEMIDAKKPATCDW